MDSAEIAFIILPAFIGLGLVAYAGYQVRKLEISFFHAATSYVVSAFVLSLAILWVFEIVRGALGEEGSGYYAKVVITFTVVAIWLSTCAVALVTIYRRHNLREDFVVYLKERSLNFMTAWGLAGLALISTAWVSGIRFEAASLDMYAWLLILVFVYLIASAVFDIVTPIRANARGEMPQLSRDALVDLGMLAAAWITIPSATLLLDLIVGGRFGLTETNPYLWVTVIMFILLIRSISFSEYAAIIVDPEIETARREGFRAYDIPRGVYLIYDDKAESALSLFSELVTLPLRPDAAIPVSDESPTETLEFLIPRGLVVTREFPNGIRERHGLQVTPMIWLTETPGELRIAPTSLAVLTDALERFMETNRNSIVLVEGIEYIVTFNDFKKVLRSLDLLNEEAWMTKARLMITVNPRAFNDKERALLERDRIVLRGPLDIEELKRESKIAAEAVRET